MNLAPIDKWTLVHLATGFATGAFTDVSPSVAFAGAVVYEVAEQVAESTAEGQALFGSDTPESALNVLVDLVAFGAAFAVGRSLRGTPPKPRVRPSRNRADRWDQIVATRRGRLSA